MRSYETIRLVVCGAGGQMGRKALCLFPLLRETLSQEGIALELAAVLDNKVETHEHVLSLLETLVIRPQLPNPFKILSDCLNALPDEGGAVIVYDASATTAHFSHLLQCQENGVHYFGEKPLVTTAGDLKTLKTMKLALNKENRPRVFVDFIETHSSPFDAAASWLSGRAPATGYSFWREGVGGIKKFFSPRARKGVQGGAILDKAVHDISLLYAFLRLKNEDLDDDPVLTVQDRILMPADIEAVLWSGRLRFLGTDNKPRPSPRGQEKGVDWETADAEAQFTIRGSSWEASFCAGWLGTRHATIALRDLGLDPGDYGEDEPIPLLETGKSLPIRDSRLCVVDCGGKRLVLDFVYKGDEEDGGRKSLVLSAGKMQRLDLEGNSSDPAWRAFRRNTLGRVFATVCRAVLGRRPEGRDYSEFINEQAALWVHSRVIEARKQILDQSEAAITEMAKARIVVRDGLKNHWNDIHGDIAIGGAILDLDNTLIATREVVTDYSSLREVYEKYFDVRWDAIVALVEKKSPGDVLQKLREKLRSGFTYTDAENAVYRVHSDLPVKNPVTRTTGYEELLQYCDKNGIKRALVTSGLWGLQAKKIEAANLARDFSPIVIDDARCELGKKVVLRAIAETWELHPRRIVVIGDDPDNEIKAAEDLDMKRVHLCRDGAGDCPCGAHGHVANLNELVTELSRWMPSLQTV